MTSLPVNALPVDHRHALTWVTLPISTTGLEDSTSTQTKKHLFVVSILIFYFELFTFILCYLLATGASFRSFKRISCAFNYYFYVYQTLQRWRNASFISCVVFKCNNHMKHTIFIYNCIAIGKLFYFAIRWYLKFKMISLLFEICFLVPAMGNKT